MAMVKITYVDYEGEERDVEGLIGETVMETAVKNGVPGIDAQCGGACACATCHVYVDEAWLQHLPERDPMEASMLEFAVEAKPNSRLSCQLDITQAIDGLRVTTPESQL